MRLSPGVRRVMPSRMGELQALLSGRSRYEGALRALLARHGAVDDDQLVAAVREAVAQTLDALGATSEDGTSLAPLDVVRIRANKLAASRLAASLWHEPRKLAALRAEINALALDWLGPGAARGARFPAPPGS